MSLRLFFLTVAFLLASGFASAQQTVTRPAITAAPPPAAQAPAPAPPSLQPGTSDPSYVIGPGDNISVSVWKEPGLSGSFPVRPDGMISLSLVGDLPAAGFTPMQLSADIANRLKKFVTDPSVNVTVLGVQPKVVYMIGEIGHIGPIAISGGMTVLQAIATAGGLSPYANAKHIYILRNEQGRQRKIPFDYKKALKTNDQQGVTLVPGDTIVIP